MTLKLNSALLQEDQRPKIPPGKANFATQKAIFTENTAIKSFF